MGDQKMKSKVLLSDNPLKLAHKALKLLSKRDRRITKFLFFIQSIASTIDLIAIALMGLIASITLNTLSDKSQNPIVSELLQVMSLSKFDSQSQVLVIGILLVVLLIVRTILSIVITRRAYFLLSRASARKSGLGLDTLLSPKNLTQIRNREQDLVFGLSEGMDALFVGILGGCITLVGDLSIVLLVTVGLFALDFYVALGSVVYFGLVFIILYKMLGRRAYKLGVESYEKSIKSNRFLLDSFRIYPEVYLRGSKDSYIQDFYQIRLSRGKAVAEMAFLPFISKYVFETAIIFGVFLLALVQFSQNTGSHAIGTLAVFLSASFRFAPSLLRIQQTLASFKWNSAAGKRAYEILNQFDYLTSNSRKSLQDSEVSKGKSTLDISFYDVGYTYTNASSGVKRINLEIKNGEFCALVGPSGSGKSTIINLTLGFLNPQNGKIAFNDSTNLNYIRNNPGLVAYVPQQVQLIQGSLRDNILLKLESNDFSDDFLIECLSRSGLEEFFSNLPNGLDSELTHEGSSLSGGQKQRLAIARALVTRPELIILDEATSNLDAQTESAITDSLLFLRGKVTVVMIAHRLSSVRNADKVVYVKNGEILALGTFDEVRKAIPDFDTQASLMGL